MAAEAYLRTWRMAWVPLVWSKQEVPARSDFVELQTVPTNYSPCDIDVNGCDVIKARYQTSSLRSQCWR